MRVLVTGGAGFIGSRIATALRQAGHDVVIADVLLAAAHGPHPRKDHPHMLCADVRDRGAMRRALRHVDVVCHQAAMVGLGNGFADACDYVDCNDLGTAALLSAMADAGVRRLVLAGSMVVYGEGVYHCAEHGQVRPGPRQVGDLDAGRFEPPCPHCGEALSPGLVEETATIDPRNVYAATKIAQEYLASAWARACAGRVISLRYHNVYGPGMPRDTPYAGVASFFRSALENGEPPKVFEDGAQRRDFVHVRDIASANLAALDAVYANIPEGTLRPYNVASGTPHTVGEMAAELAGFFGGPEPVVTGEYRLGDVRHITASTRRIRSELDWKPRVDFRKGVAEFAAAPLRGAAT
ncbi:NAD-dependent epimerase/dehydratase family protein [Stackebrandtia nassauensis]|uniref:NAD-dependent epimerase/dehydratase n=1 Tax=Stackebrandtia nassauensis (strain DSM 44728 / CIP 108903 / NRRL B-16338 / NBRC 102104 / LLR-40K-21) TaxID=446470 RepID=D3Q9B6_STANL|nr:NAD-dependent epimerase/dehydratase family protein [Stackebrandtia nassauensis]ADD42598.1 NAD-dependent epimerase/dehydratase [Stackebrandtia nassauensis DSM 44728]